MGNPTGDSWDGKMSKTGYIIPYFFEINKEKQIFMMKNRFDHAPLFAK
jgi:hypothetical protein